jgi:hypothetical protein
MSNYTTKMALDILSPTGEITTYEAILDQKNIAKARGGWNMIYKDYGEILRSLSSKNEINIALDIQDSFTHKKSVVVVDQKKMIEKYKISRQAYLRIVKKLIELKFLKKLAPNTFMLNPFMYVPFRADAKALQDEWISLEKRL